MRRHIVSPLVDIEEARLIVLAVAMILVLLFAPSGLVWTIDRLRFIQDGMSGSLPGG